MLPSLYAPAQPKPKAKLPSAALLVYGPPAEVAGGQMAPVVPPLDLYAKHAYGNSNKSRARRAAARKKKEEASKRAGPDTLTLDGWAKLGDEGLKKLSKQGALGMLLRVSLRHCVAVTAAGLIFLLHGSPCLEAIDVTGCVQVTEPCNSWLRRLCRGRR